MVPQYFPSSLASKHTWHSIPHSNKCGLSLSLPPALFLWQAKIIPGSLCTSSDLNTMNSCTMQGNAMMQAQIAVIVPVPKLLAQFPASGQLLGLPLCGQTSRVLRSAIHIWSNITLLHQIRCQHFYMQQLVYKGRVSSERNLARDLSAASCKYWSSVSAFVVVEPLATGVIQPYS